MFLFFKINNLKKVRKFFYESKVRLILIYVRKVREGY